jgi:predicted metal-dependent phosphoesterase TrpH
MLIDLHVHTTRYSSGCSVLEPQVMVQAALRAGLRGVALSEHQCAWSQEELAELRGQGLRVFAGREVHMGDLHVLIFGIEGPPPAAADGPALARTVREMGGAAILAHPFRWGDWHRRPLEELERIWRPFDAVEALSGNMLPRECQAARIAAEALSLPFTGGSDAHAPAEVGRYHTSFLDDIETEADLVAALRAGRFSARTGRTGGGA